MDTHTFSSLIVLTLFMGGPVLHKETEKVWGLVNFMKGRIVDVHKAGGAIETCAKSLSVQFPELNSRQIKNAIIELQEKMAEAKRKNRKEDWPEIKQEWFEELISGKYEIEFPENFHIRKIEELSTV